MVSDSINKSKNKSYTMLDWIMLHEIAAIYRDLKYKETIQASLFIQNLNLPPNLVHTGDQTC